MAKTLPCSKIRQNLSKAINETYVSQNKGHLTQGQADALAQKIAQLADQTFKTCKVKR